MSLRPFAAVDPRRLDNPVTGGINTVTGQTLKSLTQTQATSPDVPAGVANGINAGFGTGVGEFGDSPPVAPTSAGVGSAEDSGNNGTTAVTSSVATVEGTFNNNTRRLITPKANVLDRFASYTYKASVYLMSPEQYQSLVISRKKNINSYNLLFQSGGAPAGTLGALGGVDPAAQYADNPASNNPALPGGMQADAGRNPAFDVDFYIDQITVQNLVQGKSTMTSHGVTNLKFTVVEPNGITLIDRIYEAVQGFAPKDAQGKGVNYGNAHYLMVIRWYGYDINGNMMTVGAADATTGLTDPNAVVEKFIPFMINRVNWSVGSRLVTYEFDCTATNQLVGTGTRRGTVPYDIQLSAGSVKDLLDGQSKFVPARGNQTDQNQSDAETQRLLARNATAAQQAPAKANAAAQAKRIVTGGLMAALTQYQQTLTTGARPIFDEYDEYYIEFTPRAKAIASASLIIPGAEQEAKTSGTKPTPTSSSDSLNPNTDQKNVTTKTISITAGQPIVQIIDRVIRNSTFITGQQLTQIDNNNDEIPNPEARNKPVNWFSIKFRAEPKKYDFLRNDYAYKITYVIDIYPLDKYDSKYFPLGTFRGVHKRYPWWFTGQNTAILEYTESLNTAYNMLVSGTTPENSAAETQRKKVAASMRDIVTYVYGPGSEESRQGAESKAFEGAANLADSLYGASDLGEVNLRIIGDPAWIQQGSLAGGVTVEDLENGSFLPDGTINYDGEQPMFEVSWNRPTDYDLGTGLANPNSNNWASSKKKSMNISRVYTAISVVSEFKQGKFEQTIKGLLYQLPKPDGSNKAPTAPMPTSGANQRQPTPEQAVAAARSAAPGITTSVNGHLMTNTEGGAGIVYRKSPMRALTTPITREVTPNAAVGESTVMQNTVLQPQSPPAPPTSGTGENISLVDRALNFIAGKKINQNDLRPSAPQDQIRDP